MQKAAVIVAEVSVNVTTSTYVRCRAAVIELGRHVHGCGGVHLV